MIWLWASFLLSILFGNEILIKLLFKPKLVINSIEELNQNKFIGIVWPAPYKGNNIPVSLFINFFKKFFFCINKLILILKDKH